MKRLIIDFGTEADCDQAINALEEYEEREWIEGSFNLHRVESPPVVKTAKPSKMQRQFWILGHLIDTEEEGWENTIFSIINVNTHLPNSLKSIAIKLTGELGYAVQAYDSKEELNE